MADFSMSPAGVPAHARTMRLVQQLDDCRGFLASCEQPPRVFSRAPMDEAAFDAAERALAALCEALALPPFRCCARRPSDVNSLDLALSRYLAFGPDLALPEPAQARAVVAQWRLTACSPVVETIATGGGPARLETWPAPRPAPDAPTIVLVPLCGVPMAALRPVMRALARQHTTLCWESPALFGDDPLARIAADPVGALAGEVVAVIRARRLERVHLVAICAATAPALVAAATLGPQLGSLTICHAAVKVGDHDPATPFEQQYNTMLQDICASEAQARTLHATLLEPGFAMSLPAELAPFILHPYTRFALLRRHALVHSAATSFDARTVAPRLACATRILTTSADRMVHPEQSRRLAQLLPRASLHEFDSGNHLDVLLDGNPFLPLITSFIGQHCGRRPASAHPAPAILTED
ncbi:hypothetical protein H3H36_14525 [Duganella sp. FT3S]|uniref:Alpha/beta hydrolase n=1 Tax=Rugamonas fusca TaxID=2758568 RepID=A0A7W2EIQ0_9BURK|nr:hypothetical protein [Rugamonas fusca]MBA5606569.1 hypothetical protein [Rugamonas fusca]